MLLPLIIASALAFAAVDAQRCPEQYGVQTYPNEEYCDRYYKVRNIYSTIE